MVLRIRLARWGAKRSPFYAVVLAHARAARDGKHLERLGSYNALPEGGEKSVTLDLGRIKYWLGHGAQPSKRMEWILARAGVLPPTPKMLQAKGHLDLADKDTWNISLGNENGKYLGTVSNNVWKSVEEEVKRPRSLVKKWWRGEKLTLSKEEILLDGSRRPKEKLGNEQAVFVLKTYLGI